MFQNPLLSTQVTISRSCTLPDLLLQKTIYEDGCELPRHAHEEARFIVVLQGTFSEVSENFSRWICRPSTLLFRPAGQFHSNQFQNGRTACISIRLGPSWLDRFLASSVDWRRSFLVRAIPFRDWRSNFIVSFTNRTVLPSSRLNRSC